MERLETTVRRAQICGQAGRGDTRARPVYTCRVYTTIEPKPAAQVFASGLIAALDAELDARYPGTEAHTVDPETFESHGGLFLVAVREDAWVGCAAFRRYDERSAEIKRVYVRPEFRRRGVARALLDALEQEARRRGYERVILETGERQPEALMLYRSSGYREIEVFEPYVGGRWSVCFEKRF